MCKAPKRPRKPIDLAKKRYRISIAIKDSAWQRICARAAYRGCTTNDVIQRWAERLPFL